MFITQQDFLSSPESWRVESRSGIYIYIYIYTYIHTYTYIYKAESQAEGTTGRNPEKREIGRVVQAYLY